MSTPPAYWVRRIDLFDLQRPSKDAQDIDSAEKGGGFDAAPPIDFPLRRTPNRMTHRVSDWAPAATTRQLEAANDGDLEKVRAVTRELQDGFDRLPHAFGRLPRAAQLPPVTGLPVIDKVPVADVHPAAAKRITAEPVPIGRLRVPPVRQRGDEFSRPAKLLVAVAISAPLAGYFAIAGPYPMFGEAASESRSVQPPSLTVQPVPQGPASGPVNQTGGRDKADAAPKPVDAKLDAELRTEEGPTVGSGERVAQPPPNRESGSTDVAAAIDGGDTLIIAHSDIRSLTRAGLDQLLGFAWYPPTAWSVPTKPADDAHSGLIEEPNPPAPAPGAVTAPLPTSKDTRKDFILADSSRQSLTREELQGLSIDQLVIARNEIFARKGRYFKEEALRDYFAQFAWYQPHSWDVALSLLEQANVELIQSVEQSLAGRHAISQGRAR
jgi:YARHG domain